MRLGMIQPYNTRGLRLSRHLRDKLYFTRAKADLAALFWPQLQLGGACHILSIRCYIYKQYNSQEKASELDNMGCGASKADTSAKDRSDAIEAQLKKDRLSMRNEIKMWVLTFEFRVNMH